MDFHGMIPRRDEAHIAEDTARRRGDAEKVATAASPFVVVKGIEAYSRYQKDYELALMAEWIWSLSPWLRPLVSSVFCDSKAQWTFTITCRHGNPAKWQDWYAILAESLDSVCVERVGGHNGIYVNDHRERELYMLDPEWFGPPGRDDQ